MHPDEVEGDDDAKDGGSRVGEEVEDPTQPLPELPAPSRQSLGTSRTKPVTPDKGKHFLHVYFGIMSEKEQNDFNSLSILIFHMRQLPLSYLFIYVFQSEKKNHLDY